MVADRCDRASALHTYRGALPIDAAPGFAGIQVGRAAAAAAFVAVLDRASVHPPREAFRRRERRPSRALEQPLAILRIGPLAIAIRRADQVATLRGPCHFFMARAERGVSPVLFGAASYRRCGVRIGLSRCLLDENI